MPHSHRRFGRLRAARVVITAAGAAVLLVFGTVTPAGAGTAVSGVVSSTPESYTPNIQAGTSNSSTCSQWFDGGCSTASVYSTAVVNGEVVVAGAFTSVGGHTYHDLVAYNLSTGAVDTHFTPTLNEGPAYAIVPGPDNTVIVGGRFTSVDGASHDGLVELDVTPGTPSTDGAVVSGFTGRVNGFVRGLAINGSALYVGGQFSKVDGQTETDLARLNASTGAYDSTFGISVSQQLDTGNPLKVWAVAVNSTGTQVAVSGAFLQVGGQSAPRLGLINTGQGLGYPASPANWQVPMLQNDCSAEHDYVRDVDFSPDGSYLAIGDTGYMSNGDATTLCDAVARIPTTSTAPDGDVTPTWIDYAGGDSMYSVAVTNSAIYFGGHNRWLDNECGNNAVCEPNAVLVMGVSAVDPNTGLALPWWHPLSLRGAGTMSVTVFGPSAGLGAGGLIVGNDVATNGGSEHSFNAIYPLTNPAGSPTFGSIPSGLWALGDVGGSDEGANGSGTPYECLTQDGATAELATCTNSADQNWTDNDGVLSIGSDCLDVSGSAAVVDPCSGAASQTWTQGTDNELVNSADSLCLDDPGGSTNSGTALQVDACTGAAEQAWPLPAAPVPPSLTPDGPIQSDQEQASSQPGCLDLKSHTVEMETCLGGVGQNATINTNQTITIDGQCLDVSGSTVVLDSCSGSDSQQWSYQQDSNWLVNSADGECLTINDPDSDDTAGDGLVVASCGSSTAVQGWRLPAV